jgi:pyrroloquinoline quinone (PQQ) biosynthesis protein C
MGVAVSPSFIPVFSPHATVIRAMNSVTVDCPDAVTEFMAPSGSNLLAALDHLDGRYSVSELAHYLLLDAADLCRLLEPLVECVAVWDGSGLIDKVDPEVQLATYYDLCDGWAKDIFVGPFWSQMLAGTAAPVVVLGWCEQFYHRTVGADEHNATAVGHCSNPALRADLAAHFAEELGHGEMFLRGLEACGMTRASILAKPPLPTTRALIEYMDGLGKADTLAYLACYGVLHSPRIGQNQEQARSQFQALVDAYPFAAPAIGAVAAHAQIDLTAGHDQIVFETHVRRVGGLSRDEALRSLRAAHGTVKCFNGFFAGILETYGSQK